VTFINFIDFLKLIKYSLEYYSNNVRVMIGKFLSPKNDVAFRKIFGTEKNKDILIHFLNDIIDFDGKKPICDVTFLKTIQDPEIKVQKTSIVDILCKDQEGNRYIVEMQVAKEKGFEKRAQFYASKAYTSKGK
jgi:predicted transposase/invertase (TIGR01784 family)